MNVRNALLTFSRIVVGIVFIFSGFVKGVDPVGSMIKINEYLIAFNWDFLKPLALTIGIGLNSIEFILGVALIFGSRIRLISWITLILMALFTIQTFVIAMWIPVTDCGCFGDAIKLTNWQTFNKNIVIDIFIIFIFLNRMSIKPLFRKTLHEWLSILAGALVIIGISVYCYLYLPILDFRPYKVGNDIKELMTVPEGAPIDEYETILVYKNVETGKEKEFTVENIPDQDIWEWVATENILIVEGEKPKIHDFKIFDPEGNEITDIFLEEEGYRILIAYHMLETVYKPAQEAINKLVKELIDDQEVNIWALTSSIPEEIDKFKKVNNIKYNFYSTDIVPLETMIRSNPGILLLKNNKILKKWSSRNIPDSEDIKDLMYK